MGNLKLGDVVKLKSGSPLMTIETMGNYGGVTKAACQWFDGAKVSGELFPLHSLVLNSDE
jgi:uncharacterized protein YodC (DUF2158 family)